MRLPSKRRDRLQLAIVVNQLATPGLGSWFVGRRVAGFGQMALGAVALTDTLYHSGRFFVDMFRTALQGLPPPPFPSASWNRALMVFAVAWLWAAVSSTGIWLELRGLPPAMPPPRPETPPRLS
ncbi:MAG: hypothetical protein JNL97_15735 [Verrucomicrobiales bacterium]|nr:hypothetical protein [Verrucomicrobiales bacterium]